MAISETVWPYLYTDEEREGSKKNQLAIYSLRRIKSVLGSKRDISFGISRLRYSPSKRTLQRRYLLRRRRTFSGSGLSISTWEIHLERSSNSL